MSNNRHQRSLEATLVTVIGLTLAGFIAALVTVSIVIPAFQDTIAQFDVATHQAASQ